MKDSRNMREIKEIEIGTLRTFRKIGQTKLPNGEIRYYGRWKEEKTPLDLGSISNPKNNEILSFEINVPSGENIGDFFKRVLK